MGDPVRISWRCLTLIKLEWLGWRKNYDNMLSCFYLIPERHGQTERQTDRRKDRIGISISRVSVLTRGKKNRNHSAMQPLGFRLVTGWYFSSFCVGKIGKNTKIGQLWRPGAPQPYVVQKSLADLRKSLALGLQRGVNTISLQCIPWSVACSEWGACLTDLRFQILGQVTPKMKIFENVLQDSSTEHRITFRDHIWWKSAIAKLPKGHLDYYTKKLGLRGTHPSSHFAQNGPIAPKIDWTLSPFNLSMYTEFGPDRLRFAGLIPERLICRTISTYNSFQPRITSHTQETRSHHGVCDTITALCPITNSVSS